MKKITKIAREQLQPSEEITREQLQAWQKKLPQNNSNPGEEITREQIQA
ncbi:2572_t:CDS:2 [Gigaspora margarita]|uniref:2572_t:CDS:1 n=1 Tax=Gigaspora margarita TaxID=4874 RepID=A0ABM8W2I0_GIGMA|nr:2572_t:CDS:2 [Gigaspora margarita]